MTPLEKLLLRQIETIGPMTIAEYMNVALTHPDHGYYTTRDPLGSDFTTAPEISQMFGELIGLALASAWADQGAPAPFVLAELGPGKGTLMADALRATARVPGFNEAARVCLVEASPALRSLQKTALKQHSPTWVDTVGDLPNGPLFLVANEFFDALPVRQFLRDWEVWRERVVGARDHQLTFGLTDPTQAPIEAGRIDRVSHGDLVSYSPASEAIIAEISTRIASDGGVALVIDYGDQTLTRDTFQSIYRGQPSAPLDNPGEADLTNLVDFGALKDVATAQGARAFGPVPQGTFLARLGIDIRADALARIPGQAESVRIAHRRLTDPSEMGNLFKAIAIGPSNGPTPPGFAT